MNMNSITIPEDFICPITQELMKNPVVAADGQSYEKEAILCWLQGGHETSPLTGLKLKSDVLIENYRLKSIIETFQRETQRERQIKDDLEMTIGLMKEMIVQEKEEKTEYAEALKRKSEENDVLKTSLLKLQKEMQTKRQSSGQPVLHNENNSSKAAQALVNFLKCSICHKKVLESLVFRNVYCKHQYCLSCIQAEGKPSVSLCYLRICPGRLSIRELTQLYGKKTRLALK